MNSLKDDPAALMLGMLCALIGSSVSPPNFAMRLIEDLVDDMYENRITHFVDSQYRWLCPWSRSRCSRNRRDNLGLGWISSDLGFLGYCTVYFGCMCCVDFFVYKVCRVEEEE